MNYVCENYYGDYLPVSRQIFTNMDGIKVCKYLIQNFVRGCERVGAEHNPRERNNVEREENLERCQAAVGTEY